MNWEFHWYNATYLAVLYSRLWVPYAIYSNFVIRCNFIWIIRINMFIGKTFIRWDVAIIIILRIIIFRVSWCYINWFSWKIRFIIAIFRMNFEGIFRKFRGVLPIISPKVSLSKFFSKIFSNFFFKFGGRVSSRIFVYRILSLLSYLNIQYHSRFVVSFQ